MSTENIANTEELNQEQLAEVSGGRDSGQYYKLGDQKANVVDSKDDKELSDGELGQVAGGAGDGGQYYRLGDRQNS